MKHDFDVVVIGAGSGGMTASKTARGFGKSVALIEKEKIGGECTWTGCVPSKSLIKAAEIAYQAKHAQKWGITAQADTTDTTAVMSYVRDRIQTVSDMGTPEDFEALGIKMFFQTVRFIDAHTLQLADKTIITADKVILCTGSDPFIPPIEGLDTTPFITNKTFFEQDRLPSSLLILGGGPVGAEMASACNRLGVKTTIIEMQERILPKEDAELVALLTEHMQQEGVQVKTGYKATKAARNELGIELICVDKNDQTHTFQAEQLLVAVGRRPSIQGLDLENAGVQTTKKGIKTDNTLKTTAANIYACGDVVGPYLFSHTAWYQSVLAVRNALIPLFKKKLDYTNVIWVTFTAPELATAGLSEQAAIEQFGQKNVILYKMPYARLDRAITDQAEVGLVKCVCNTKGKLLGIHILGARAGDIIHEAQLAKTYNIPLQKIQPVMHAYPTYSELIWGTSKKAYLDQLLKSPLVRIGKWFMGT